MISDTEVARIADRHFDRAIADGIAPGLSYAVLAGGELVHWRGLGVSALSGSTPDDHTIFRIASMTKSFTAATLLSLRDDGSVDLGAPVFGYVPELRRPGRVSELTVRHLLTMTGGFLTDDPWGDRQQEMSGQDFKQLLSGTLEPSWRPGERFEYSNLGYAILGLVIEAATGEPYRSVVEDRILRPLQLIETGFDTTYLDSGRVATGYVSRDDAWHIEPLAGHGAFAPMGGLLSSAHDIARWVGVMLSADNGQSTASLQSVVVDQSAPLLSPASLREMQSGQRFIEAVAHADDAGRQSSLEVRPSLEVRHYGYGLFEEHLSWGRSVAHSGGYPGFGSHMRWHPASGLGIVALANRTYAPVSKVATAALAELVHELDPPAQVDSRLDRALQRAQDVVTCLLNEWNDHLVGESFTDNVGLDEPWDRRRSEARRLAQRHGDLRTIAEPTEPNQGPGHVVWWLRGAKGGRVRCEAMIAPTPGYLIQWFRWHSVEEPPSAVRAAASRFLGENYSDVTLGDAVSVSDRATTFVATGTGGQRWEVTVSSGRQVVARPSAARVPGVGG